MPNGKKHYTTKIQTILKTLNPKVKTEIDMDSIGFKNQDIKVINTKIPLVNISSRELDSIIKDPSTQSQKIYDNLPLGPFRVIPDSTAQKTPINKRLNLPKT